MAEVVWPQICSAEQLAALCSARRRDVEDTLTPTLARRLKEQMCTDVDLAVRSGAGSVDEPLLTDPPTRHQ